MNKCYFLYILKCSDGSYYVGTTSALEERFRAHNEGRAARYTTSRRPVTLVYSEEHPNVEQARSRERQIKCWSRAKKEALISGDRPKLKKLSKRHIK
ncbi:MAG: GIY-YIG nuclease family protein [Deltaproteobacteria bacterium]|nr:GIY-YIG nuclease family protein [Deltaproteobacteria bacterium]MBW2070931.1 GIY-YIG nuclease family protein [Deltaproteobacteria bacterium]